MSSAKTIYKNAPISEVIFGVTFDKKYFEMHDIFRLFTEIFSDFNSSSFFPPLANEILKENGLIEGTVHPQIAGQSLIRSRTVDKRWLLQAQGNKFYLNWTRPDEAGVGSYPGYESIKTRFFEYVEKVENDFLKQKITENAIQYELTYINRIEWQNYIENVAEISRITNIKLPDCMLTGQTTGIGIDSYAILADISGYSKTSLQSTIIDPKKTAKKALQFENLLRGNLHGVTMRDWFDKAHDIQITIFEDFFTEEVKNKWK